MMGLFREAIDRWLHTDGAPLWRELELPDDWQSITFRSDKVSEEFSIEVLHAAPFTTHFVAPAISARQEHEQVSFQWLRSEQSPEEGAQETNDTGRLHEKPYWQHVVFDRTAIDTLYQRSAEGDSVAREQIELFEAIVSSFSGEKVIFCGDQHRQVVQTRQGQS